MLYGLHQMKYRSLSKRPGAIFTSRIMAKKLSQGALCSWLLIQARSIRC